jgi:hypothetical protein
MHNQEEVPIENAPMEEVPMKEEVEVPNGPIICIHNYMNHYNQETDRIPSLFPDCSCNA